MKPKLATLPDDLRDVDSSLPIGQRWELLLELEASREVVGDVLRLDFEPRRARESKDYFVLRAGPLIDSGPWPVSTKKSATAHLANHEWVANLVKLKGTPSVVPWDELSAELPSDPDFCAYVVRAARHWVDQNDWKEQVRYITRVFAFEGMVSTVEYAGRWHSEREKQTGRGRDTWITRIKGHRGDKPIARLAVTMNGRPPSEVENRDTLRLRPVSNLTGNSDDAGMGLLDCLEASQGTPIDDLISAEDEMALAGALEQMPKALRDMLKMRYEEGLTLKEIAKLLNISYARASEHMKAALAWLRENLNPPEAN